MKAVRYHETGEADVLRWEDAPDPVAGPDDLVIRVEAAGVNYADVMRRSGKYHFKTAFPAMLGTEAAGPDVAIPLYEAFLDAVKSHGVSVAAGRFGAMMQVELVGDGPVTLMVDSK